MHGDSLIGFHTLLPERGGLPALLDEAFKIAEGIDPVISRVRRGGCEIFGIAKEARRPLG